MLPAFFFFGLQDIDRNFLACFGKTDLSMYSQIPSPLLHIMFCYLFIEFFGFGIIGCGIAMTLTNFYIYCSQNYLLRKYVPLASKALKVSITDRRNFQNLCVYCKLALPSMVLA